MGKDTSEIGCDVLGKDTSEIGCDVLGKDTSEIGCDVLGKDMNLDDRYEGTRHAVRGYALRHHGLRQAGHRVGLQSHRGCWA